MKAERTKMKRKHRVVMFGHKSIPSLEGGIEVVVQEITARMSALGHDITCLNRGGKHDIYEISDKVEKARYHGVKLKVVPTIDIKGIAAASSSFFSSCIAAAGPYDIVHIHAEGPAAFCWIPKLFGKKIVVTIHGLDWQRDKWKGFARRYIYFGEKMAVAHADEIIVLSQGMKKYFKDRYGRETVYIPNGVACIPDRQPVRIHKEFGLEKDGYYLYLARLVPEKKADVLIEAFKKVKTDKKLVIAGPDSNKDPYICKLHQLSADDSRIIFTGFVKGQIFEELMSNAYVYVLPSKLEGMPLSLLEAMSFGNCCVTTNIAECKEVIGSHGLTVEPENVEDLRDALQYLENTPSVVEQFRTEIRSYVESRYSWDDVVSETLNIYQKLEAEKLKQVYLEKLL